MGCVAGPGLAQLPQQLGDGPGVVEAGLGGGPVGQCAGRVPAPARAAPAAAWRRAPRVVEADVGRPGWPGAGRIPGPSVAQAPHQLGDGPGSSRLTWAAARSARGWAASRRPPQLPQQLGGAPRVVEAGVDGGVAGQQRTDRVVGPGLAQLLQQLGDGRTGRRG